MRGESVADVDGTEERVGFNAFTVDGDIGDLVRAFFAHV